MLCLKNIPTYVDSIDSLKTYLHQKPLHVSEMGDGNLNFIFRIKDSDEHSVILKFAPPYLRLLGPSFELPQNRICVEMHTLSYFQTFAPSYLPKILHMDEKESAFLMEDLSEYETLQKRQLTHPIELDIYAKLGDFLGLLYTHKPPLKEEGYFENDTLKSISEHYIFRYPIISNHEALTVPSFLSQVKQSALFHTNLTRLTELFCSSKETLVHGDLHTGSVMIRGINIKIIDAEFSFFGPIGFDVGTLFAHILFGEIYAKHQNKPLYYEASLSILWEHFVAHAHKNQTLLQTSIGFCGCEIFRRLFVPAKAKPLEMLSDTDKEKAYHLAHALSVELIENSLHVKNFEEFLSVLKKYL